MKLNPSQRWTRFQELYWEFPECGLSLDLSRLDFARDFLPQMNKPMLAALGAMRRLEAGDQANSDEERMVGHYWLRNSALAPSPELQKAIAGTLDQVKAFSRSVHEGRTVGERGPFKHLLVIGIGGSALGPQFVSHALGHPRSDRLDVRFLDNTDPDGIDCTLTTLEPEFGQTLVIVISKSGTTPETRNGLIETSHAYRHAGLRFSNHAVAITEFANKSRLYTQAKDERWLAMFPMWDWVGGRTSVTSAVGLLPAALQGLDIDQFLAGAATCDELTRNDDPLRNPAALMALSWYHVGQGRGSRDMVVLPYKDRLAQLSKYLQQLVMESLGKELDLDGRIVHQGIAVYGNKGSTDQHAYVQQLRDGLANFFVVFVHALKGRDGPSIEVEPGVTSADYLNGFLLGTRSALHEKGRPSLTVTVAEVSPFTVGALIALFERAVGLYASLIRINAYHQPGVQAGKTAAAEILSLQGQVLARLEQGGGPWTAEQLASEIDSDDPEMVYRLCLHLSANHRGVARSGEGAMATFEQAKP
jgi:glucose-6-phosphate isomerase